MLLLASVIAPPWLSGCGGDVSSSRDRVEIPRRTVSLDDCLVPEVTDVLRLRPRAIIAADATRRVASSVFPEERLDAFSRRHGVDLRDSEILIHATHPEHGSIVLLSGPFHARVVVAEIGHRMAPLESSADAPVYRRAGLYRSRRLELLALGPHELAVVDGTPAFSALLVDCVRAATPTAAHPRLRAIIAAERAAPFLWFHHGRFEDLPPEGIGLLLARLEDLAVTLDVARNFPESLEIRAQFFGEFPPGAEENFRAFVESLAQTDLGHAFGLSDAARSLAIEVLEREVRLTTRVRAVSLARGLRIFFAAELEELFEAVNEG